MSYKIVLLFCMLQIPIICLAQKDSKIIRSIIIKKRTILFYFSDSSLVDNIICEKIKIKKKNGFEFFTYNNKKFFLLRSIVIESNELKIDSIFNEKFVHPQFIPRGNTWVNYSFLLDKSGKILNKGLLRNVGINEYQKQYYEILTSIKFDFEPLLINGEKVPYLYFYEKPLHIITQ